ncbi:translation initiation factor IF-2-like [Balaenoptera musculus]|uniref:Translation initiation factor IF-2-like n=1 Tax=Balaenoptera musculus TaxID=9771 RepID=A0A8B8Z0E0_BALMU|nr:translation initiation factor IF-2-like [Balaenoptera musculus]
MPGRRRQPLAGMTGPRGSRGARPPPAPPGAYPGPGRRRPAAGPGQPRRRVLPGSELRPRKAPPFRAHGCRADLGQRPAAPDPDGRLRTGWGHVFVFLFKPAAPKGKAAGLRESSGVARQGDSRSGGRGRERPAGRRLVLAAVLQGRLLGNHLLRRLRSRQPGCSAAPAQSLFQHLGSPWILFSENCWGLN